MSLYLPVYKCKKNLDIFISQILGGKALESMKFRKCLINAGFPSELNSHLNSLLHSTKEMFRMTLNLLNKFISIYFKGLALFGNVVS